MKSPSRVVILEHQSEILVGNPLGDASKRKIYVYLPPDYQEGKSSALPTLLGLVGFTGTGASLFNIDPLSEDLKSRLDRLILSGSCPPMIVVAPDCFTKLGGSQYINSSATGRYEDYLTQEIIPFIENKYTVSNWGIWGKSSGGYGAIVLGMRNPQIFKAIADHSGDSCFELCYLPDFPKALNAFKKAGGPAEWLKKFWADVNHKRGEYHAPLNALAMAAAYSPNPKSIHLGIDFPFDLETGVFKKDVWERWHAWDPVTMADNYLDNLKQLRLVYVDCGTKDEFGLQWGARALVKKLKESSVSVHYEEFDDGHMSISYRYNISLPLLAKAL